MWFSHPGKLGALPCPKTIQIFADPNCFIFSSSAILSSLWCPKKCRKLKLIAIFVFGNDSDCCSTAENKHVPLIKHPSGHENSLCFLQLPFFFSTLPLFTDSVQYLPLGKRKSTQKTGNERMEMNSSITGPFLFPSLCFQWQKMSRKGQRYWNKTRLFHLGSGTMEVTWSILLCVWALF